VNFGIGYGLSVFGLMDQLGCDEATAVGIISAWMKGNPVLAKSL